MRRFGTSVLKQIDHLLPEKHRMPVRLITENCTGPSRWAGAPRPPEAAGVAVPEA